MPAARGRATITQKAPGVISGLDGGRGGVPAARSRCGDRRGSARRASGASGGPVLRVEGSARALLTAERTALNFLGRLSGVATKTARVVRSVGVGRGEDPRHAQDDARDAHAREGRGRARRRRQPPDRALRLHPDQGEPLARWPAASERRCGGARAARPELGLAVEVRDAAEIDEALEAGAQRLLLDNMTPDEVRAAVAQVAGRAVLEVSGGVDEETVLVYATISGVDYVSIGALTHSAPVLDLSLILETVQ